jgi:predicted MFS family arabinose efflux permease
MSRGLIALFAVAVGLAVANNYWAQPLLATIRADLHISGSIAGLIITASQVGYAAGLVLLLPLGDLWERRGLVTILAALTAVSLAGAALAPSIGYLLAAAALIGLTAVLAQILVPFAASLAGDAERGRVVGTVMSGLLVGILMARTVAGFIAQASSWRVVYVVAAGLMVVLAAVLRLRLPRYREDVQLSYARALASVVEIARHEPVLRRRSLYGVFAFASFSVLWTSLAFLLSGPHFGYGEATIGLFGLVGAAGAAMANTAGRLADRGWSHRVTGVMAALLVLSFVLLWIGDHSLLALIAGIVVLDIGTQVIQVTNQSEIYRLQPLARSRITSFYMTCYFVGGAVGSAASAFAYERWQWSGVCALGEAIAAAIGVLWMAEHLSRRATRLICPTRQCVAPHRPAVPRLACRHRPVHRPVCRPVHLRLVCRHRPVQRPAVPPLGQARPARTRRDRQKEKTKRTHS